MAINPRIVWSILFLVLAVTTAIYYPALNSRFILDDYYNLKELDQVDSRGMSSYVFAGMAGPSGRPVSLLSFALQHEDWPDNPFGFKLVNLLIHLVCGVLIFILCRLLLRHTKYSPAEINFLGLVTASLWLLSPMQITTVLYVVQRMTQLSAFFVLTGLVAYLFSRNRFMQGREKTGLIGMTLSVCLSMVFGILCKENAILIPLFILVTEFTLFSGKSNITRYLNWRIWAMIFLVAPIFVLLLYFAFTLDNVLVGYERRLYSMSERLITQPVVLLAYLKDLVLPSTNAFGLFHDDFPVSTGLLSPAKSLVSLVVITLFAVLSILMRKQYAVFSFCVLWFLAGHSLESSHLNLEIYFEHRNYVPSVGIFLLMSAGFIQARKYFNYKFIINLLYAVYFVMVLFVSVQVIETWKNPALQAIEWAESHPESLRAIDNLASMYLQLGEYEKAAETYHKINDIYPAEIYPYIKDITITYCYEKNKLSYDEWNKIIHKASKAKYYGYATLAELDILINKLRNGDCKMAEADVLMYFIIVLAHNPEFISDKASFHNMATTVAIHLGDAESALANIEEAVRLSPTVSNQIYRLKIYISLGKKKEAVDALARLKDKIRKNPLDLLSNNEIVNELEEKVGNI